MSGRAYVAVRPLDDHPIRVICAACGIDQPAGRWHNALHEAKLHNETHHGKGAE